ncbi:MAG: SspB family protein [Hyphomicrobium sp.]
MTTTSSIDYEKLHIEAMRGVVRSVLESAAKSGLPGDHHFYISFDTTAPDVSLSDRLLEKYPEEMTIVLQHRFWDLFVHEDYFEVKLTFDGIPERLVIPFNSLKVFFDPSVRYGLQFGSAADKSPKDSAATKKTQKGTSLSVVGSDPFSTRKPRTARKIKSEKQEDLTNPLGDKNEASTESIKAVSDSESQNAKQGRLSSETSMISENNNEENSKRSSPPSGAEVLSLDKFRKK